MIYTGMVLATCTVSQDHSSVIIPAGTMINVTAGGAMETAIGPSNLLAVSTDQNTPAAASGISNQASR